jgi:hypothetical protein
MLSGLAEEKAVRIIEQGCVVSPTLAAGARALGAIAVWRHGLSLGFASAEIFLAPNLAYACAMCGLPAGDHSTHAFNTSVLFLLCAPYVIFGGLAAVVYAAYHSARRKRSQAPVLGPIHGAHPRHSGAPS